MSMKSTRLNILKRFKRNRNIILICLFFLYLGYFIASNFITVNCEQGVHRQNIKDMYVEYAVLILSSPYNIIERDAIRNSWVKLSSNLIQENGEKLYRWSITEDSFKSVPYVKHYFVVGTRELDPDVLNRIEDENRLHNDLLLLDNLKDSYFKLTLKMLYALKWISENLKGLKYLIKCDDDSFVRIDLIVRNLEAFAPSMNASQLQRYVSNQGSSDLGLFWGYFNGRTKPRAVGKWKEHDWFLGDNYLPYAVGGGYVLSKNIVDFIGKNYAELSIYNAEDVSMGVWTAAMKNINRVHDIRFDTEWKSRGCLNNLLVRHKQSPDAINEMFKTLVKSKGKRLCKTVMVKRKAFKYNWNRSPAISLPRKKTDKIKDL